MERGSTRKINKNTCEGKAERWKNTGQNINLQMFSDCSDVDCSEAMKSLIRELAILT